MDLELPRRAIAAFEQATGLTVCVHSSDPLLMQAVPPDRRRYHHHAPCRAAKATRTRACQAFCGDAVPRAASGTSGHLVTRCHAGHAEVVAAVRPLGRTAAVLFAGVARPAGDLMAQLVDRSRLPPLAAVRRLPLLTAAMAAWQGELLAQLAARLAAWLTPDPRVTMPAERSADDRAATVQAWVAQHAAAGAGLVELARTLDLSVERTRRIVAAACGRSWRAARREARLQAAAALLRGTEQPVARIVRQVGYSDPARFSASFRRRFGVTPRAWRQ